MKQESVSSVQLHTNAKVDASKMLYCSLSDSVASRLKTILIMKLCDKAVLIPTRLAMQTCLGKYINAVVRDGKCRDLINLLDFTVS